MLQSLPRSAIPNSPGQPHRKNGGYSRRSYILFLVRQQAQAGLLRDGGTVPDEVGDYVLQLRREIEAEIAVRFRKQR